jgi:hypothetical protein
MSAHHDLRHCGFKIRAQAMTEVEYPIAEILEARGDPAHRWFKVEWEGDWGDEQYSWLHKNDLKGCDALVEAFWESSGLDKDARLEIEGEHRCGQCNKTFKTEPALKGHKTKSKSKGGCQLREGSRIGSLAEKELKRRQQKEIQKHIGRVMLGEKRLENVFEFKYLGHLFQADGDGERAVQVRLAIAKMAFSKLFSVWDSKELHTDLKLKLYITGIVSILAYGVEAWDMNEKVRTRLRGWNSRCLHTITGRSYRDEAVSPTFDLVASILSRRQKWLGHVLRSDPELGEAHWHKTEEVEYKFGSLLSEAPRHKSAAELIELAELKDEWRFWTWIGNWAGKPWRDLEDPVWEDIQT